MICSNPVGEKAEKIGLTYRDKSLILSRSASGCWKEAAITHGTLLAYRRMRKGRKMGRETEQDEGEGKIKNKNKNKPPQPEKANEGRKREKKERWWPNEGMWGISGRVRNSLLEGRGGGGEV